MSHRTLGVLLAGLLFAVPVAPAAAQTPSCLAYMPDPRAEAEQGPDALTMADALVTADWSFLPSPDPGMVRMVVYPWTAFHGSWVPACRRRDYQGQPWSGVGSAMLVGSGRLLTAGHLFPPIDPNGVPCEHQRYVFGYGNFTPGQWQMTCDQDSTVCWVTVPERDVYSCQSVVLGGIEPGTSGDWAVVTLDRRVWGRTPLRILRDPGQFPPLDTPVTIVGHPNRIPMKVENVTVKNAGPSSYRTTGHVLRGNSGGMAVDDGTGRVIGIVVAGGHRILPGCQPQMPPGCHREWFEDPGAGAWLTPAWLAKDYIPEP
jgi:hypothetical protein